MAKKNRARNRKPAAKSTPPGTRASEADEIVHAIRHGGFDAVVSSESQGDRVLILQGAEHPYRVLIEAVNDGAATLDPSGTILFANSRFAAILGVDADELVGTSLREHLAPYEFERLRILIAEVNQGNTRQEAVFEGINGSSRIARFVLSQASPSQPSNICVVATELTELREANKALVAHEESLRQLSAQLLQLQDDERRRIARDLHDITGQKLVAQSMDLAVVLRENGGRLQPKFRRLLTESAALAKEVVTEIRTLSYLLHPPLLDDLGLAAAVRWYASGFEKRTGIATEVSISRDLPRLPPDVEIALFRIVQESLTNVHRYSGSPSARVKIEPGEDGLRVEIADFGKGMRSLLLKDSPGPPSTLGVGIQGMRERMRQLSGKLEISSGPQAGTRVVATIPLHEQPPASGSESRPGELREAKEGQPSARPGERKRILIADDHEMLRQGLGRLLETRTEWEVCGEAADGREAVEKALSLKPDLVILDVNMPLVDGLAATRQILQGRPETKILVFTVHESRQTREQVHATGAHGYLPKNRAGRDLLKMVSELLFGRQLLASPATAGGS